jgi:hypothetical protein
MEGAKGIAGSDGRPSKMRVGRFVLSGSLGSTQMGAESYLKTEFVPASLSRAVLSPIFIPTS